MRAFTIAGGLLVMMSLAVGCGEPTVAPTESTTGAPKLSGHEGVTVEAVVATIPVGTRPQGVGVNPSTNRVYVSNTISDNVSVIATVTPEEAIELLIDQVEALVNTGSLNQGQGGALIKKLEAALQFLDRDAVRAAIKKIQDFINQVNAFVSGGPFGDGALLSQSQGNRLIDAASNIINALGG